MPTLDATRALQSSQQIWDQEIVPALYEYIRIPNKSPAYEPQWQQNMDRAVALIQGWCRKQPIRGLSVEVVRLEDRTPVILMEIPGEGSETVLLYGHLDKQPEMTGWRGSRRGCRCGRATGSTGAEAPTTAIPASPRSPHCGWCRSRASRTRAAWS
jgi:hypothetical protein